MRYAAFEAVVLLSTISTLIPISSSHSTGCPSQYSVSCNSTSSISSLLFSEEIVSSPSSTNPSSDSALAYCSSST
uniref:Putative secreted peptide n=1 Tax=Anopheles braziliensis TaxID=58242 RepID=A0A2M3ZXD1_9DIPT